MNNLRLTLKTRLPVRLDMRGVLPEVLSGQSAKQVGSLALQLGRERALIEELFDIETIDGDTMEIRRASPLMFNVGADMSAGSLKVTGSVGDFTGAGMTGGSIHVSASTGQLCGAGMSAGEIHIGRDAGDWLGASLPGSLTGMAGGSIYVRGNAGTRAGEKMRRGTLVIEGNCDSLCGASMIAGTIIVLGECGPGAGTRMRRGTILLRQRPGRLDAGFRSSGQLHMPILQLMFRTLPREFPRLKSLRKHTAVAERIVGDLAVAGKGEIIVLADPT